MDIKLNKCKVGANFKLRDYVSIHCIDLLTFTHTRALIYILKYFTFIILYKQIFHDKPYALELIKKKLLIFGYDGNVVDFKLD